MSLKNGLCMMKSLKICPNYKLQLRIPVFICHSPCVIYVQLFYRSLVVGTMLLPYAEQGIYNLRFFSLKKKCRFVKGKSIVVPLPTWSWKMVFLHQMGMSRLRWFVSTQSAVVWWNSVEWNVFISGYVGRGLAAEALNASGSWAW